MQSKVNYALSWAFYDKYHYPGDRIAFHIGVIGTLLRNRAYSQALQLVRTDYPPQIKLYTDLVQRKGWTRPDALDKVLTDMKHLRDEMLKIPTVSYSGSIFAKSKY